MHRRGEATSGPAQLASAAARAGIPACSIFLRKCNVISFVLQTLKFHRNCSVNANEVIQISLGSLDEYLSDDIGLIILGAI
jgi:hypothetical protein